MIGKLVSPDREADEQAIRRVEAAYDAAWDRRDLEGLLACLTEDAVLVNPRGAVARGHEEIRRELGSFLDGEASASKHSSLVNRIEFVTNDVAVVDGEALIERPGDTSSMAHGYTDVLVRREGEWRIAHVRAYGLATVPPNSDS